MPLIPKWRKAVKSHMDGRRPVVRPTSIPPRNEEERAAQEARRRRPSITIPRASETPWADRTSKEEKEGKEIKEIAEHQDQSKLARELREFTRRQKEGVEGYSPQRIKLMGANAGNWPLQRKVPFAPPLNPYIPMAPGPQNLGPLGPLGGPGIPNPPSQNLGPLGPLGFPGVPKPPFDQLGQAAQGVPGQPGQPRQGGPGVQGGKNPELFYPNAGDQAQYMRDMLEAARAQYEKPYDPYLGQRFAPENPYERATNTLAQRTNTLDPFVKASQERMALAQQSFPQQAQSYMNPYMQNVTDEIAKQGNRNLTENILPALKTKFVRLGQRASSGRNDLTARAARDIGEGIAAQQRLAMHAGYGQAADIFGADQGRRMQGAEHEATLGRLMNAARLADVSSLRDAGTYNRELAERKLRSAEEQHLNKQRHGIERFNLYKSIAGGLPSQSSMSHAGAAPLAATATGPRSYHSGDYKNILGLAASNLMGQMFRKRGGHVK